MQAWKWWWWACKSCGNLHLGKGRLQKEPYPAASMLMGTRALLSAASDWAGGQGHKLKHGKLLLHMRRNVFFCADGQTLAQVAQRGCWVSLLGELQNPIWHGPGQFALGDSALSKRVVLDELWSCFLTSAALCFCGRDGASTLLGLCPGWLLGSLQSMELGPLAPSEGLPVLVCTWKWDRCVFSHIYFPLSIYVFKGTVFRSTKTWKKRWMFCCFPLFALCRFFSVFLPPRPCPILPHPRFSIHPENRPVLKCFPWDSWPDPSSLMISVRAVSLWRREDIGVV